MSDQTDNQTLDSTNTIGLGIREASGLIEAEADASSGVPLSEDINVAGVAPEGEVNADWQSETAGTGTGMGDNAAELTDINTADIPPMQGNSGTWQSDNPAGTGAGMTEGGAADGGWERDNDANQIDVNPTGIQHVATSDANEGNTFAYADGEDRTPPEE